MPKTEKAPLEQIKAEVAEYLGRDVPEITRVAMDAFLVQAFDAGSQAQRDLDAEVARVDAEGAITGYPQACRCGGAFSGLRGGIGCSCPKN